MSKSKRFQSEEQAPAMFNTRQRREQRRFALTVIVAVVLSLIAFYFSRGNKVLHLPFQTTGASDRP